METIKFDYHIHSNLSRDSEASIEQIIEVADERLDAIAITDHDRIENSLKAKQLSPDSLTVIPGIEITSRHGHIIGLGVEERIEKNLSAEKTAKKIKKQGGAVIVPHPFQFLRHGISKSKLENLDYDCLEVLNSRYLTGLRNRQAKRYAEKLEVTKVAGSDAHKSKFIGTAFTELKAEGNSTDSIIKCLKEGRTLPCGNGIPRKDYISQAAKSRLKTITGLHN